ncbi:MAG: HAD family hydrolase [Sphingomonadaceae bacterium]
MRYKLVCFDFDHTLSIGKTAAEHASELLACGSEIAAAEHAFRVGELTTWQFTDLMAMKFRDCTPETLSIHMTSMPVVSGIADTVKWLKARGLRVVINTVGFRDLMLPIGEAFGFDAVSGVRLTTQNGRFTGAVSRYFPLEDKIGFARDEAAQVGAGLDHVIAIGDGLSDLPLFQNVRRTVAFNAPPSVEAQAHFAVCGQSTGILHPVFETILSEQEARK